MIETKLKKIKDLQLKVSSSALKRIEEGFHGNGCGSGPISKGVCGFLQRIVGGDFTIVWDIHDSEYTESRATKTATKKIIADSNLYYNINTIMGINDEVPQRFKRTFARWLYVTLILGGHNAYWEVKSKLPSVHTWILWGILIYLLTG